MKTPTYGEGRGRKAPLWISSNSSATRASSPDGMAPFRSIANGMIGMPTVSKRTPRAGRQPLCPSDQSAASSSSGFNAGCLSACAASGWSSTF